MLIRDSLYYSRENVKLTRGEDSERGVFRLTKELAGWSSEGETLLELRKIRSEIRITSKLAGKTIQCFLQESRCTCTSLPVSKIGTLAVFT